MKLNAFCAIMPYLLWCKHSEDMNPTDIDNATSNATSYKYYNMGVEMGIVNPKKYSFRSFRRDEKKNFKVLYREFRANDATSQITYKDFLIMNNFGILPDSQESLLKTKKTKLHNSTHFVDTIHIGDILLTSKRVGGYVGHTALVVSPNHILEMSGGLGWYRGIKDNNQLSTKYDWYKKHQKTNIAVYRVPLQYTKVARNAANWALREYYGPKIGPLKEKHITYYINTMVWATDPSYCSKLVVQAYYYGNKEAVISGNKMTIARVVVPVFVPGYFEDSYYPEKIATF